jgi:hypothetical protein
MNGLADFLKFRSGAIMSSKPAKARSHGKRREQSAVFRQAAAGTAVAGLAAAPAAAAAERSHQKERLGPGMQKRKDDRAEQD